MKSKKKLLWGGIWLLIITVFTIAGGNAMEFDSSIIINTSISNTSVSFYAFNVSIGEVVIEPYNITFTSVNCSNGVNQTSLFFNFTNAHNDSASFCVSADTNAPSISNLREVPADPATYSSGAKYEFNATVTDASGLDKVILTFNGTNYTTYQSGNVFNVTINNLGAGFYEYLWYANDTSGNAATSSGSYTINKASGVVNTWINGSRANKSFNNGTQANLTGNLVTGVGNINLYINNSLWNTGASPLINFSNFTVGTYTINTTYLGNANFTYDDEVWTLTISLPSAPSNVTTVATLTCRYKKLGYFNLRLPWTRQINCI